MNYTIALGNTIFIAHFMGGGGEGGNMHYSFDIPESFLGNFLPNLKCVFLLQYLDVCIKSKTIGLRM